jgi:RHS repeat-associated protein
VVTNYYNGRGLPSSLSGSYAGSLVTSALYNQLGSLTEINVYNTSGSTKTTFGYYGTGGNYDTPGDYYGRLWEIKTVNAASTTLQDTKYTWDPTGNLIQRQNLITPTETETFTYDFLDRLSTDGGLVVVDSPGDANRDGRITSADETYVMYVILGLYTTTPGCDANQNGSISMADVSCIENMISNQGYFYDELGNIISKNGAAYTYGSARPHAVTQVGNTGYTYDANGNMINRGNQTISWDVENRPVTITGGASFVYDGDGNRVKKTEGGITTLYINQYYEKAFTSPTPEITTYYYFGSKLVAQMQVGTLNYIHQDSLGSTSVTSDVSGSLVGSIKYFPFGFTRSGSVSTDKQFTGQRLDSTGLYYYGARYYDPTIGRFISPDTVTPSLLNPQALNRYSYAFNNPLKYKDPTGHWPDWGQVGSFFKGVGNAAVNTVKSTVQMVVNPVQTAEAIGYAVTHPVETFNAIKADYIAKAGSAEGIGELTGEALITIAGFGIGGSGIAKGVQVISKVAKTVDTSLKISRMTDSLVAFAQEANEFIAGSGKSTGITKHTFWERQALEWNSELEKEVSFLGGNRVPYGTGGSTRVDLMLENSDNTWTVWELKTGNATLNAARILEIQNAISPNDILKVTVIPIY